MASTHHMETSFAMATSNIINNNNNTNNSINSITPNPFDTHNTVDHHYSPYTLPLPQAPLPPIAAPAFYSSPPYLNEHQRTVTSNGSSNSSGNHFRSESYLSHQFYPPTTHRNGDFLHERDTTSSIGSYNSIAYPTSAWPQFGPSFNDLRVFPTFSRPIKQKRPRMSLQKRLMVNARERERMRVLNKAFESLRDALPCYIADGHMAKITTLRLAINYIKALGNLLNEQNSQKETLQHNPGYILKQENQEEIFSNIFRESASDGVRPIFKDLDERLAISKRHKRESDNF